MVSDEVAKTDLTERVNKFVNMSQDAPHSDTLHKTQVENYITQIHEDYKINTAQDFSAAFNERLASRVNKSVPENKIIEEINNQIDNQYLEPNED